MKHISFATSGTCSKEISISISDDGLIDRVEFFGGCHGNLQGIAALVRGLTPAQAIERLEGIRCRDKETSCPDQLARALKQYKG